MALPIIDVPTFILEIPGTKDKLNFRPFLVKESKILTLASASEDTIEMVAACQQVIQNCSFGKLDAKKLAMFQLQWIFLQLRTKSVGNIQEFVLICGDCKDRLKYEAKLDEFKLKGLDNKLSNKIEISSDTGLVLKYPSAEIQSKLSDLSDAELLKHCIDYIYQAEEIFRTEEESEADLLAFIDNLSLDVLEKVSEFFRTIPVIEHIVNYTCKKCERENTVSINGYEHFFF